MNHLVIFILDLKRNLMWVLNHGWRILIVPSNFRGWILSKRVMDVRDSNSGLFGRKTSIIILTPRLFIKLLSRMDDSRYMGIYYSPKLRLQIPQSCGQKDSKISLFLLDNSSLALQESLFLRLKKKRIFKYYLRIYNEY